MNKRDLSLPDWGPYSKSHFGLSHIADREKGARFDTFLFFGDYRRNVISPAILLDNGVKAFRSAVDFSDFTYRHLIDGKDRVYCDASFINIDSKNMLIKCRLVNNTEMPQTLYTNMVFSIDYPHVHRTFDEPITPCKITKSDNVTWISSVEYKDIKSSCDVAKDGFRKAEFCGDNLTGTGGISGDFFGFSEGDFLSYNAKNIKFDSIAIRYRLKEKSVLCKFLLDYEEKVVELTQAEDYDIKIINFKSEKSEKFTFLSLGGAGIDIDGFAFGNYKDLSSLYFEKKPYNLYPSVIRREKSLILNYEGIDNEYLIIWDFPDYIIRSYKGSNLDDMMRNSMHLHFSETILGKGNGHYSGIFLRPILLEPNSVKELKFSISCSGNNNLLHPAKANEYFEFKNNSEGNKFKSSQDIMAACTLMNVVYPRYFRGDYILHNTPGKFFDTFYTWDSGFIGMGLCTIDTKRAIDCLNTYLNDCDDTHAPFILHGTPMPTQIFLYLEIWNTTNSLEYLKKFYDGIKQAYSFLADMKSNTNSGILKTWHLFYNSGGWDDYPPQKYVHQHSLAERVAPVVTTSVTVLFAKILKMCAKKLGFHEDVKKYSDDIDFFSDVIEKLTWDEESGYYGYAILDENGCFNDILKYDNLNFNMGMDGIYPYISGISNDYRKKRILSNIKSDMLTPFGISAVSLKAPYYLTDGYWNGTVWMPHQWTLWKSLLDNGEIEFANRIAHIALNVWKNEVDETYNCYEHFLIQNGRGAGYHQFSGLSTPALMWFKAYYVSGSITGGFLTWIDNVSWSEAKDSVSFDFESETKNSAVIVCLNENYDYKATLDNNSIEIITIHKGTISIKIPPEVDKGTIRISNIM